MFLVCMLKYMCGIGYAGAEMGKWKSLCSYSLEPPLAWIKIELVDFRVEPWVNCGGVGLLGRA
jgi:hypothetical protein